MQYHYLIAGLPNIEHDESKPVPDIQWLKSELEEQLTPDDMRLVELVSLDPNQLPLTEQQQEYAATLEEPMLFNYKLGLYYQQGLKQRNDFVRRWFEYQMLIGNILTAATCRKHGLDVKQHVIGDNETAQLIRTSNAKDFNLPPIVDDYAVIAAVAEESDLYVREHKIDALKWQWLEQNSFDKYFGIEQVIAYWLQVRLLNRWKALSVEQGTQAFRALLAELKKDTEKINR